MAKQTVNDAEGGGVVRGKINDNFTELYNLHDQDDELIKWTAGKNYELINITRDAEGRVTSASAIWPDGSTGTYTATNYNATHEVYDGYTISHTDSGKTVTQAAVTRNSEGAIITKPQLTVA